MRDRIGGKKKELGSELRNIYFVSVSGHDFENKTQFLEMESSTLRYPTRLI